VVLQLTEERDSTKVIAGDAYGVESDDEWLYTDWGQAHPIEGVGPR